MPSTNVNGITVLRQFLQLEASLIIALPAELSFFPTVGEVIFKIYGPLSCGIQRIFDPLTYKCYNYIVICIALTGNAYSPY